MKIKIRDIIRGKVIKMKRKDNGHVIINYKVGFQSSTNHAERQHLKSKDDMYIYSFDSIVCYLTDQGKQGNKRLRLPATNDKNQRWSPYSGEAAWRQVRSWQQQFIIGVEGSEIGEQLYYCEEGEVRKKKETEKGNYDFLELGFRVLDLFLFAG